MYIFDIVLITIYKYIIMVNIDWKIKYYLKNKESEMFFFIK